MNIKEAKEEIKNTMRGYFIKDDYGGYIIPSHKQRPIFMLGAPGIGKTAIVEQIAQEMNVGVISYSMTHHTRQSALGLPFITKKEYGGNTYDISQYTMSEIIASIYNMIEDNGQDEGILFLDEINCVSETLTPVMLQFLQYKTFGTHAVPEGWIILTAGNPPEFNKSVREYDVATWDRLKKIEVEPNFEVWKEYAYANMIHGSILSYLEIKKEDFYTIENSIDGMKFATPRGWEDLSNIIDMYELMGIEVSQRLVEQYIQHKRISKSFSIYYDLYNKYKSDYQIDKIVEGKEDKEIRDQAKKAKFDERLTIISLMIDYVSGGFKEIRITEEVIEELIPIIVGIKQSKEDNIVETIENHIERIKKHSDNRSRSGNISKKDILKYKKVEQELYKYIQKLNSGNKFTSVKKEFDKYVKELQKSADKLGENLKNIFKFTEGVYGQGQEILILVTELTVNKDSSSFINKYGCDEYFKQNKELLFYERQKQIISQIENMEVEV